jgi:histone H3/H4
MGEIIIKSRIKDYAELNNLKFQVASDFPDALSKEVERIIKKACERAQANGRKTIMAKDL